MPRARWAVLAVIGVAAALGACAPSNRPAVQSHAVPTPAPAVTYASEAPRHYGSSTQPRIRHRAAAKRPRYRHEVQQAEAEWVNPPFDAGE